MKVLNKVVAFLVVIALMMGSFSVVNSVSAKVVKRTGSYITWLMKKSNNEIDAPYAKKIKIKSNKMTIYGRINYNTLTGWNPDILYPKKRTFVFSKYCKYYKGWPGEKTKKISKRTWKRLAKKIDKGNTTKRMISWDMKQGRIVKMWFKNN